MQSRLLVLAAALIVSPAAAFAQPQAGPDCTGEIKAFFDRGMATLTEAAKDNVVEAAKQLAKCPHAKVTVTGNIDGAEQARKLGKIGLTRATNVRAVLVSNGVKRAQVKVSNARFTDPALPTGAEWEPMNRRVVIEWHCDSTAIMMGMCKG
jgi:outer membrane protein OmpA-like peptidoglycan-associated protein